MTLDFAAARENMVENQVRTNDVTDHGVQDAMAVVARERLLAEGRAHLAYAETAVEYASGLHLLEPRDIAKLLQAIRPRAGERALALAGPYAALVLRAIGLDVTLRLPAVDGIERAVEAVKGAGAVVKIGDLATADPAAPFAVIVAEGAVAATPAAWPAMLAPGGRLAVIERKGPVGRAVLYARGFDDQVTQRAVFDSAAPYLPGFQPQPAFEF